MSISAETKARYTQCALIGERTVLVPYGPHHVSTYHAWMADPALQRLTASEPLSLEAEIRMQTAWAADLDKLTFIVLCKRDYLAHGGDETASMVGDVNVFLSPAEAESGAPGRLAAELEIMIAEARARRRGLAHEAVQLMMAYTLQHVAGGLDGFVAKIAQDNAPSLNLFTRLGFTLHHDSPVFHETVLVAPPVPVAGLCYRAVPYGGGLLSAVAQHTHR